MVLIPIDSQALTLPKVTPDSCKFYLELESQLECQEKSNYLTAYGYKYCERFKTLKESCNNQLKIWVTLTAECLQKSILLKKDFLKPCKVMEGWAYSTHPVCYAKSGFCELDSANRFEVYKTISILDILNLGSVAQALQIKSICKNINYSEMALAFFASLIASVNRFSASEEVKNAAVSIIEMTPNNSSEGIPYFLAASSAMAGQKPTTVASASAIGALNMFTQKKFILKFIPECNKNLKNICAQASEITNFEEFTGIANCQDEPSSYKNEKKLKKQFEQDIISAQKTLMKLYQNKKAIIHE